MAFKLIIEDNALNRNTSNRPYWIDILHTNESNLKLSTSYDTLHLTELALYSHRKLGTKPLDINTFNSSPSFSQSSPTLFVQTFLREGQEGHVKCQFSVSKKNWTSRPPALPSLLVHMSTSVLIQFRNGSTFNKRRLNYGMYNKRPYKYLADTQFFGCKHPCMYQFLRRNTQKLYFCDNMFVYKNTTPRTNIST